MNNSEIKGIYRRIFDEGKSASSAKLMIFTVPLGRMSSSLSGGRANIMRISQLKNLTGRQLRSRS
jgi:hypothetical protein